MSRWQPLPIVGGAYTDDVTPWTSQDRLNYMVVNAERNGTRSPVKVQQCPGASVFSVLPAAGAIRGLHNAEGLLLAVCGTTLYTIAADGTPTSRGTIPGVRRVSMAHNQITGGNEVFIANGLSGYVYNTKTATLAQITDGGFIGAKAADFIDGYIAFVDMGGRFWGISDLADATSYNTLDRSEAEAQPDKITTLKVSHREIAVFGERSTEFYSNTGATTGTFQRVNGTELEIGCPSTFGVVKLDNTLFFVGHDGGGYMLQGYQPVRITTHAIEQAWSRCNLSAAYCYTFEDQGHKIWYVTFTDGQTWGYDVASQEWHRRASKGLDFWRMSDLVRWNGAWIAGDYANGKLYQLDWNLSTEAGDAMERRGRLHVIHDEENRLVINALKLVFDTGKIGEPTYQPAALSISGDLPDSTVGISGTYQYTVSGGIPARTVTILSGSLPPGATMDANGLVTYDYTTAGSYAWVAQVEDANGDTDTVADTAEIAAEGFDPTTQASRYLLIDFADGTDYSAPSYDDSAWPEGFLPLGTSDVPDAATYGFPAAVATTWPLGQNAWFRGTFEVGTPADMELAVYLDDGAQVWINGVSVFSHTTDDLGGTTYYWTTTVTADKFVAGTNNIAIKCRADIHGVNNYVCYRLAPA